MRCLPLLALLLARSLLAEEPKPIDIPDSVARSEAEMKPYTELIEHTKEKFELVPIKGGRFVMGSPADEKVRKENVGDAKFLGFRVVRPLREPSAEEKAANWDKYDPPQLDREDRKDAEE